MFASKHPFQPAGKLDVQRNPCAALERARTTDLPRMVTPSQKGERSEAAILKALVSSGRVVLMPWGASQRYDFVIDEGGGRFTRVQCKSGVFWSYALVYFERPDAQIGGDPTEITMSVELLRPCTVPIGCQFPRAHRANSGTTGCCTPDRSARERPNVRDTVGNPLCAGSWSHGDHWQPAAGAEDGIRTRDPNPGKIVRYHCATSARRAIRIQTWLDQPRWSDGLGSVKASAGESG